MLDRERIILMTKLAVFQKNEGADALKTCHYFKGDYVFTAALKAFLKYTLCFLMISLIILMARLQEILLNLNLENLRNGFMPFLSLYLAGAIVVTGLAVITRSARYERNLQFVDFYKSEMDRLLALSNGETPEKSPYSENFRREIDKIRHPSHYEEEEVPIDEAFRSVPEERPSTESSIRRTGMRSEQLQRNFPPEERSRWRSVYDNGRDRNISERSGYGDSRIPFNRNSQYNGYLYSRQNADDAINYARQQARMELDNPLAHKASDRTSSRRTLQEPEGGWLDENYHDKGE